jgi:hypothetical protein
MYRDGNLSLWRPVHMLEGRESILASIIEVDQFHIPDIRLNPADTDFCTFASDKRTLLSLYCLEIRIGGPLVERFHVTEELYMSVKVSDSPRVSGAWC